MIEIDTSIPHPVKTGKTGRPPIYPWIGMSVGDSFFVTGKTSQDLGPVAAYRTTKNPGEKYTTRSMDGGVRVWRIA